MINCLKSIGRKPITYENDFLLIYWAFLSERQLKYVEDIVVTRDTAKLGMSRKDAMQVILDTGQGN